MPGPAPERVALTAEQREELLKLVRSGKAENRFAQRLRIILLSADGLSTTAIAEKIGCTRKTVIAWRDRFLTSGIDGLKDRERRGRPALDES